jgi:deoxyribose-phosphate aldolase
MTPATDILPTRKELARFIDYLLLSPDATKEDVVRVCAESREHGFGCVCVNTSRVVQAYHLLEESAVQVIAAVGFPLGAMDSDAKRYETEVAVDNDAHFIEVVANIGRVRDGDHAFVLRELRDVVEAADERPVGIIIEAPLLTREQIELICKLTVDAGAKSIVTSTGIEGRAARIEDVRLIKEFVGEQFGIKAVGGISDTAAALALIGAGATRIGMVDPVTVLAKPEAVRTGEEVI